MSRLDREDDFERLLIMIKRMTEQDLEWLRRVAETRLSLLKLEQNFKDSYTLLKFTIAEEQK